MFLSSDDVKQDQTVQSENIVVKTYYKFTSSLTTKVFINRLEINKLTKRRSSCKFTKLLQFIVMLTSVAIQMRNVICSSNSFIITLGLPLTIEKHQKIYGCFHSISSLESTQIHNFVKALILVRYLQDFVPISFRHRKL